MVEVSGLHKSYDGGTVLHGIDLAVPEGSVLALLGPNGAGKTTTVRILATLLRPDAGSARIGGYDVVTEADQVRRIISLAGQFAALDESQTGRENLIMVGQLWHLGRQPARRRAADLLEQFDLVPAADRRVSTWSGGMKRRLDLAMSLVGTPRVLFLDEPTTGLDPTGRSTMWEVVRGLLTGGVTVVLTTQYLEEADRLADHVVVIDGGRVAASGTPAELKGRVGGSRLELRFLDTVRAGAGAALLARLGAVLTPDAMGVGLAHDGSATQVRRVLAALDEAGIEVATVNQHQPTLDDVYADLTGGTRS
jgi:ABC-2 type transport system ATP-binding protein